MTDPAADRWLAWGPLAGRYQKPRPKRILALDGGGIRGVLTLQVLKRIETLFRERYEDDQLVLSDVFEQCVGTSTGAIIAASIARGMSVDEVTKFYSDFGRNAFTKRPLWQRLSALYENGPLEQELRRVFGDVTVSNQLAPGVVSSLAPWHLKTLLTVVTRNATTDSAWPVSSNPDAKYNDTKREDCNLNIPLWQLVRASTAAPVFFKPEVVKIDKNDPSKDFVFVDGATTAYNCPAFLAARMATEPAYRLGWERGERKLLIVSIGTGSAPVLGHEPDDPNLGVLANVSMTLSALMSQSQVDQDLNCRTVGRCSHGDKIDSEVGDLIPRENDRKIPLDRDLGKAFLYTRYEATLTPIGLAKLGFSDIDAKKVGRLDGVDSMDDLARIGRRLAERVDLADFGMFADPHYAPAWKG